MLFSPKFCSAGTFRLAGRWGKLGSKRRKLSTVTQPGSDKVRNGSEFSQISKPWIFLFYHAASGTPTAQKSLDDSIYWVLTRWTSLGAQTVKRLPTMQETWVRSLGWEDPLEKAMATHSSTLAWKIPWMEERGRLQSMGSQRVGHDWATSLSLSPLVSLSIGWLLFLVTGN